MQNLIQKEIVQTRAQKIKEILEKSGINVKDRDIEFGGNFYIIELICMRQDKAEELYISLNESCVSIANFQKYKSCVLMTEDLQFIANTVNDYF